MKCQRYKCVLLPIDMYSAAIAVKRNFVAWKIMLSQDLHRPT